MRDLEDWANPTVAYPMPLADDSTLDLLIWISSSNHWVCDSGYPRILSNSQLRPLKPGHINFLNLKSVQNVQNFHMISEFQ